MWAGLHVPYATLVGPAREWTPTWVLVAAPERGEGEGRQGGVKGGEEGGSERRGGGGE